MARETQILAADGLTLYQTVRRDADGFYYNGVSHAFDAPPLTTWANYILPLTRTVITAGVKASYVADFPAVTAGSYSIDVYIQAGASPSAAADGEPQWESDIAWSGTSELSSGAPVTPSYSLVFPFSITATNNGLSTPQDADVLPLLTDAGGTYGVKRLDTGAVVVAALGGTVSHDGVGVYSYTLANAIPGVSYVASFKVVVDGTTTYLTKSVTATVAGGNHYANTTVLQSLIGSANLNDYAALTTQGSQTEIAARIESALTDSDSRVNARFAKNNNTVPSAGTVYYSRLATAAGWYAIGYLYRSRSLNDENGRAYLQQWESFADMELDEICWALSRDASMGGPMLVSYNPAAASNGASCAPWWAKAY